MFKEWGEINYQNKFSSGLHQNAKKNGDTQENHEKSNQESHTRGIKYRELGKQKKMATKIKNELKSILLFGISYLFISDFKEKLQSSKNCIKHLIIIILFFLTEVLYL